MNTEKLEQFMSVYAKQLETARREKPEDYKWPVTELPAVLERIRAAVIKGSFNKDGLAFKRTCKELGLKHTYTAISVFLKGE